MELLSGIYKSLQSEIRNHLQCFYKLLHLVIQKIKKHKVDWGRLYGEKVYRFIASIFAP